MRTAILAISTALVLTALPQFALADGRGAVTGAAGGAVTGAVIGGPVGAAVGGATGAVVGGVVSEKQHHPTAVIVQPVAPCQTTTTQSTDNLGNSTTVQRNDCPPN